MQGPCEDSDVTLYLGPVLVALHLLVLFPTYAPQRESINNMQRDIPNNI
jgi:hypothetical protein